MKQRTKTGAHGSQSRLAKGSASARKLKLLPLAILLVTGFLLGLAQAQVTKETADVIGQGPAGSIVSPNGATLWRSDTGVSVSLRMPTPVPGTYDYPGPSPFQPEGAFAGHPEAYSLWLFAFNDPEGCLATPCDIMDFAAGRGMGGAFNAGGHVVGGPILQLAGRVNTNSTPFGGSPLLEPRTAEVHLAVAPHGALQPDVMPNQITTPIGTPAHWWLAFFLVD
jgi:hypothetical protein